MVMTMNKDSKFEHALIVSEEGRAIRLYLNLNPHAFEFPEHEITDREIHAVADIFGLELDEVEFFEKIRQGRLENLLMGMEKRKEIERRVNEYGLTEYLLDKTTEDQIKKRLSTTFEHFGRKVD